MKRERIKPHFGIVLFLAIAALLLSNGCAPKRVDPLSFANLPSDEAQVEFPPTDEELINKPNVLLPLIIFKDLTVTPIRQTAILGSIHDAFESYGHFSVIPQDQVNAILNDNQFRKSKPKNVADAIHIGKANHANYVSQIQISILESQLLEGVDTYKANVNLAVFKTDTGQAILQADVTYDTKDPDKAKKSLKNLVQTYFKLQGYILETRGGHQVARISIGSGLGIQLDREFEIRERIIETEVDGLTTRTEIIYLPDIVGTAKVVKVSEDESWLLINPDDQEKIKKGQVVFSLPEKGNVLDVFKK